MAGKLTAGQLIESVRDMLAANEIHVDGGLTRLIVSDVLDKLSVRPPGVVERLLRSRRLNDSWRRGRKTTLARLARIHTADRLSRCGGSTDDDRDPGDPEGLEDLHGLLDGDASLPGEPSTDG